MKVQITRSKLGYGGTKEEMGRLLEDAERIAGLDPFSLNISSFDDIVTAIHIVQTEMGITGTTAKEAASTIQGSLGMTKAAYANLITGLSDENADLSVLVDNLVTSATTAFSNLTPVIQTALTSLSSALPQVITAIVPQIPGLLQGLLPGVVDGIVALVDSAVATIPELVDIIANTLIPELLTGLIELAPELMSGGVEMITKILEGITQTVPAVISYIPELVTSLTDALTSPDSLGAMLSAAIDLVLSVGLAIIEATPEIINSIPYLIVSIVNALTESDALGKIAMAGVTLLVALIKNLPEILLSIGKAAVQILLSLYESFTSGAKRMAEVGVELVRGLWEGILSLKDWLWNKVYNWINGLWTSIKDFFGIASPSKQMAWIGRMLDEGLAGGITDNAGLVLGAADKMGVALMNTVSGYNASYRVGMSGTMTAARTSPRQHNTVTSRPSVINLVLNEQTLGSAVYVLNNRTSARLGVNLIGGMA